MHHCQLFSQGIQCMGDRRQNGLETALIKVGTSFIDDFGLRISSKQSCLLIQSSEKRSELTFKYTVIPVHCHQRTLHAHQCSSHPPPPYWGTVTPLRSLSLSELPPPPPLHILYLWLLSFLDARVPF